MTEGLQAGQARVGEGPGGWQGTGCGVVAPGMQGLAGQGHPRGCAERGHTQDGTQDCVLPSFHLFTWKPSCHSWQSLWGGWGC